MGNRAKATDFILKYIDKMLPGSPNTAMYKELFAGMSDKQFDTFMSDLESGKVKLSIVSPNYSKNPLTIENNLKVADELGYNFFKKIWVGGNDGSPTYLTPVEYMVVDLPVRRASQLLIKKISVPKNSKVIDSLTGQVTGDSKGAKISYPELQICAAMGMEKCMVELIKYRGGDNRGNAALNGMISRYGKTSQAVLSKFASGVVSTNTLKTFLTCMHLKSNL